MQDQSKTDHIQLINDLVKCVDMLLPGGRHLALSGDDICLLNKSLIAARKVAVSTTDDEEG